MAGYAKNAYLTWEYTYAMSSAYNHSIRIAGQPCPAGHSPRAWSRYQKIAKDTRLARFHPDDLPDSCCALYELTKMPSDLLYALMAFGSVSRRTPAHELREIRFRGEVPVTLRIWANLQTVSDLAYRIEEVRGEFG